MLYGLAIETALKARIIELDSNAIDFREKRDGEGNVVDLQIVKIGAELGKDGHDLVKLATVAGLGDGGATFSLQTDRNTIREILAYLTDCVRWSGRYPVPKRLSERFLPTAPVPTRAFGLYMRDWLDPFLESLLGSA